jgi:hypothetical protein
MPKRFLRSGPANHKLNVRTRSVDLRIDRPKALASNVVKDAHRLSRNSQCLPTGRGDLEERDRMSEIRCGSFATESSRVESRSMSAMPVKATAGRPNMGPALCTSSGTGPSNHPDPGPTPIGALSFLQSAVNIRGTTDFTSAKSPPPIDERRSAFLTDIEPVSVQSNQVSANTTRRLEFCDQRLATEIRLA